RIERRRALVRGARFVESRQRFFGGAEEQVAVVQQQRIVCRIDGLAEPGGRGRGLAEQREDTAQPHARLRELWPRRDGPPEQSFSLAQLGPIGAEAERKARGPN